MATHEYKTTIRMHHTDSAGVIFYANLFVLAEDCFENWLGQYIRLPDLLGRKIHIPIVHAEADFQKPMCLSDLITIKLSLGQKSLRSFTMEYVFKNSNGDQTARAQTVHVAIDSQTQKAIEIPSFLQEALSSL